MDERIKNIKKYVLILNPEIEDNEKLDLELNELIDKVLIYINRSEIPAELERIIARAYNEYTVREKELKSSNTGEISTISDNGQSITYKSKEDTFNSFLLSNSFFSDLKAILDAYKKKNKKLVVVGEETLNEDTKRL